MFRRSREVRFLPFSLSEPAPSCRLIRHLLAHTSHLGYIFRRRHLHIRREMDYFSTSSLAMFHDLMARHFHFLRREFRFRVSLHIS
jgi:hypothetical protein